jgi:hypothetical protein
MEGYMPYQRKGGKGLTTSSPRRLYNYYQKRAQERHIWEEAFASASRRERPGEFTPKLFKPQTYDELFKKGITRLVNGQVERITGERAIKIKTQSYKNVASKSQRAERFIDNYILAMERSEYFDEIRMEEARRLLSSISSDALSLLARKFIIPEIAFVYAEPFNVMKQLRDAIRVAKSKDFREELKEVRATAKELVNTTRKQYEILFGKRFM